MNKEEAQHLAGIIERAIVDWIQVQGIERNPFSHEYEVRCLYRRDRELDYWRELRIHSFWEWIKLLTHPESQPHLSSDGMEFPWWSIR